MGRKRVRTLLMASITIMLCMALLVGGTYALWSDNVKVSNHLQAGTLKVKLERTDLAQWKVDERGVVSKVADEILADVKKMDFSGTVAEDATKYEKNVFGMDEPELIAPTSKYMATMRISNDGGNIAFDYNVYLKVTNLSGEASEKLAIDKKLAEQIKVTITDEAGEIVASKWLIDSAFVDGSGFKLFDGTVYVNDTDPQATFSVTIEFVNDIDDGVDFDNDEVNGKNAEAAFDLFVVATQATNA